MQASMMRSSRMISTPRLSTQRPSMLLGSTRGCLVVRAATYEPSSYKVPSAGDKSVPVINTSEGPAIPVVPSGGFIGSSGAPVGAGPGGLGGTGAMVGRGPLANPNTVVGAKVGGIGGSNGGKIGGSGGGGGGSGGSSWNKGPEVPEGGGISDKVWMLLGLAGLLAALSVLYKKLQPELYDAEKALGKNGEKVAGKIQNTAGKVGSKVSSASKHAADSVGNAFHHGAHETKEAAHDAKKAAQDAKHSIGSKVGDAAHKVEVKLERAKDAVVDGAEHAASETRGFLGGVKDAVSSAAHKVHGGAVSTAESAEAKMKSGVDTMGKIAKRPFQEENKPLLYSLIGGSVAAGLVAAAYIYDKRNGGDTFGKATSKAKKAVNDVKASYKDATGKKTKVTVVAEETPVKDGKELPAAPATGPTKTTKTEKTTL